LFVIQTVITTRKDQFDMDNNTMDAWYWQNEHNPDIEDEVTVKRQKVSHVHQIPLPMQSTPTNSPNDTLIIDEGYDVVGGKLEFLQQQQPQKFVRTSPP